MASRKTSLSFSILASRFLKISLVVVRRSRWPSSETALSINEKCQNFINTNNFDRTVVEEAARRISDASGVASLKSSGAQMSMDSVSFEGPIYRKSLESNPALSNYDVPRLLDGGCYDVPPIPVPVRIKKIVEPALQSIFSSAAC